MPNSSGRIVHWTALNTGIPCIITALGGEPQFCDWQITISPSGHAVLVGIMDPDIDYLTQPRRRFSGLR